MTTLGLIAGPAAAEHRPVKVDDADILPVLGPLVVDGSDPVLFFGTLRNTGDVRGVQLNLTAGESINLSFGFPNKSPESGIGTDQQPLVVLVAPNFRPTILYPNKRTVTTGADGKSYLVLRDYVGTASVSGTYSINISKPGAAKQRFWITSGSTADTVFDGIQRGSYATTAEFDAWYNTAP